LPFIIPVAGSLPVLSPLNRNEAPKPDLTAAWIVRPVFAGLSHLALAGIFRARRLERAFHLHQPMDLDAANAIISHSCSLAATN
jgi:hypothetical protein